MQEGQVTFVRRDIGKDSKKTVSVDEFIGLFPSVLDDIHNALLSKSRSFRDANTAEGKTVGDVKDFFDAGKIGFVKVPVDVLKDAALAKVSEEHGLSARNVPFADEGKKVLIAKAY